MISISAIKQSAKGAAEYYTKDEKNYYLSEKEKGLENSALWMGKLAEQFGLAGKAVDVETLTKILSGESPDGGQKVSDHGRGHRTGWDFTFSAPKSASLMAYIYGDYRFIEAHDRAIVKVAKAIEKHTAQVRISTEEGQVFENTGNMCIAAIRHATSREDDPQVHTHLLVPNMSADKDGTLRAMASTMIQKHGVINGMAERVFHDQKYYTAMYQSFYGKEIQSMGFDVESMENGLINIKGFSKELIQGFSKRREDIVKKAQELGIKTHAGMDVVTLATRSPKSAKNIDELMANWQHEAKDYDANFHPDQLKDSSTKHVTEINPSQASLQQQAIHALTEAMKHLGEVQTTFRYERLIETALNKFMGNSLLDVNDLDKALKHMLQSGYAVSCPNDQIASVLSLAQEKKLLDTVSQKFKYMSCEVNAEKMSALNISDDNKKAITDILESGKQTNVINVKGDRIPLLESLLVAAEGAGKQVTMIAPNHSYLSELNTIKRTHAENSTFNWFKDLFKVNRLHTTHYAQRDSVSFKNQVVIIDQAQRLSFSDAQALIEKAATQQAKVVLVNGSSSDQRIKGHVMDTIKQGNITEVQFHHQGVVETNVNLHEIKDNQERIAQIAKQYVALSPDEQQTTRVLGGNMREVAGLNLAIREAMKNDGSLSRVEQEVSHLSPCFLSDAEKRTAQSYKLGQVIKLSRPNEAAKVARITDIDIHKNQLTLKEMGHQNNSLVGKILNHFTSADGKGDNAHISSATSFTLATRSNAPHIQVYDQKVIPVAEGDKLFIAPTQQGKGYTEKTLFGSFTVSEFHPATDHKEQEKVTLTAEEGKNSKPITMRLSELATHNIRYDYAHKLNSLLETEKDKAHNVMVSLPSYMASKEVLESLTEKTRNNLHIYSNHYDALKTGLDKSAIRPNSIRSVLNYDYHNNAPSESNTTNTPDNSSTTLDRTVTNTAKENMIGDKLSHDINQAVASLRDGYSDKINMTQEKIINRAVDFAVSHLSDKEAAFRHQDMVKTAICHALKEYNQVVTAEDVEHKLGELKAQGDILSAEYGDGTRWVTKEAYECEKSIIQEVRNSQGQIKPLMDSKKANSFLQQSHLTRGQKEAVSLILTTEDRIVSINGYAGVGKSTMLECAQDIKNMQQSLEKSNEQATSNLRFLGLAPSWQAVHELEAKGIKSQTSQSLLQDVLKASSKEMEKYQNTVFLLDEYSMVSNQDMLQFVKFINQHKLKAAALGDVKQIGSMGQGKPVEMLQQTGNIKTAHMKDIVRQKEIKNAQNEVVHGDKNLHEAVKHIAEGRLKPSLEAMKKQQGSQRIQYVNNRSVYQKVLKSKDFEAYLNQNVISTADKGEGLSTDKKLNTEIAHNKMIKAVAYDYLSRTPETRENTLVTAYSHETRDQATRYIRDGLKADSTLAKQSHNFTRLRGLNITETQKRNISSYVGGDRIVKLGQDQYYTVDSVTKDSHMVTLRNVKDDSLKVIDTHKINPKTVGLFVSSTMPIASGEKIMMRITNKAKGFQTNDEFTVTHTDSKSFTVRNGQKQITFDGKEMKDCHWDYAYVKTANNVQGATRKFTIDIGDPKSPLANLMRWYVDSSRATDHYRLYTTEDKALLLKMFNNDGAKYSALETLRAYISDKSDLSKTGDRILFDTNIKQQPINQPYDQGNDNREDKESKENEDQSKAQTSPEKAKAKITSSQKLKTSNQHQSKQRLDKHEIEQALNANAENVLIMLLGEKNPTYSDHKTWAFGSNKGSLKVTMSGNFRGHWRDWSGDEKDHGTLLTLIMREKGMDFVSALEYAANIVNVSPRDIDAPAIQPIKPKTPEVAKTFPYAQKIYNGLKPIKGTVAERYLKETREIKTHYNADNLYYHKGVFSPEDQQQHPALVGVFRDNKGEFQGVEAIFLDKNNPVKADLNMQKISYGNKKGFGIELYKPQHSTGITYIAEGIETSLSIAESLGKDNHIIAISGASNMGNINPDVINDNVVVCFDNDGKNADSLKALKSTITKLEEAGKNVIVSMPNEVKTDFNDMLKSEGSETIRSKIIHDITQSMGIQDQDTIEQIADKYIEDTAYKLDKPNPQGSPLDDLRKISAELIANAENPLDQYAKSYEKSTDKGDIKLPDNREIDKQLNIEISI